MRVFSYLTTTTKPDGYWCAECGDLVLKDHPNPSAIKAFVGVKAWLHVDGCTGWTLPRFTPLAAPEPVDPKSDG